MIFRYKPVITGALLLVLGIISCHPLRAQVFPITANFRLDKPYNVYLSDYASEYGDKMKLTLVLNDKNEPVYDVGLSVSIKGAGMEISTRPGAAIPPITLQTGIPLQLNGIDLAAWFLPDNLVFKGITRQQFLKNGALPDGVYEISFKVVDARRSDVVLSNVSQVMAWMVLNDPPRLNSPIDYVKVKALSPQNQLFSWNPMHKMSPNGSFDVEYEFELYEIRVKDRNPNEIVRVTQPIFRTITNRTSIQYGPADPFLELGMSYVWRVQARNAIGRNLFKNDGFSEIGVFVYGDECKPPIKGKAISEDDRSFLVNWDVPMNATKYNVRYKEYGDASAEWFEDETFSSKYTVRNLKSGTTYQYQIKSYCGTFESEYAKTDTVSTMALQSMEEFECNTNPPEIIKILGNDPKAALSVKDKVLVGNFAMILTEVTGANGKFSGKGKVLVPFLGTYVQVEFSDIFVNQFNQVTQGQVKGERVKYDDLSYGLKHRLENFAPIYQDICRKFSADGYDQYGFNDKGLDKEGFDKNGYQEVEVNNKILKLDRNGYDIEGYDKQGYNINGYDQYGNHRDNVSTKDGQTTSHGAGTSTMVELKPQVLALLDKVDKMIETALGKVKDDNEKLIKNNRIHIKELTAYLDNNTENAAVQSFEKELKEEGLHKKFDDKPSIPTELPSEDEASLLKNVADTHIALFLADQLLEKQKNKQIYLDRVKLSIVPELKTALSNSLNKEEDLLLEDLKKNKNNYESYIYKVVNEYVDEKHGVNGETMIDHRMNNEFLWAGTDDEAWWQEFLAYAALQNDDNNPFGSKYRAYALTYILKETKNTVGLMKSKEAYSFPLGISKRIGNIDYLIALDSMVFTPTGATVNAYMALEIPFQEDKFLSFKAIDVEVHPFKIGGNSSLLVLDEDVPLRISNDIRLTIKGGRQNTAITWDCRGFSGLTLSGEFEFCPGLIKPADSTAQYVRATFKTSMPEWGEFMGQVSIDPFMVDKLDGFTFHVDDAYFDFSDVQNPPNITFPEAYSANETYAGNINLWQGFYLRELRVELPTKIDKHRKNFTASNLIIDNMGISGHFGATGLVPYGKVNIAGIDMSLDSLGIVLECNKIKGGGLKGLIGLPIMEKDTSLAYTAVVQANGDFLFNVVLKDKLNIPLFVAKAQLQPNSSITLATVNKKFVFDAVLHGKLDINANLMKNSPFKVSGLAFQDMKVSSRTGFDPGLWSADYIGTSDKIAGFSFSITELSSQKYSPTEVRLNFVTKLNLMENKIGATAKINLIGRLEQEKNSEGDIKQRWKYGEIDIVGIGVKADLGAIAIDGYLEAYSDDKGYGSGFKGNVKTTIIGLNLVSYIQFGSIDNYRYWYCDAMMRKEVEIPGTGLSFYAFGGGAYYHMRQSNFNNDFLSGKVSAQPVTYIPDKSTGMGFKAMVAIGTIGYPDPFNGDMSFEMAFHDGGGLKYMSLAGNAYLMSELEIGNPNRKAPIYANAVIMYDFENSILHGTCKAYVNAAGGMIKGRNANNLAGEIVIHFSKQDWYIHVGKPSSRIGLKVELLKAGVEFNSYFMIGTVLEPMPDPPAEVLRILGAKPRNPSAQLDITKAKGFAFGAAVMVDTGELTVLIFYAQFSAGLGFDIMIANYGPDAHCAGSTKQLGINGWYAKGQAYAFVEGKIGIKIKIFGAKLKKEILAIGAAVWLQAELPNPFWMKGQVGGYYRILGGKIKGKCNFKVEIGNHCSIINTAKDEENLLEDFEIISQITPDNDAQDVSVFSNPQIVFNLPLGESFPIIDENEKTFYFRVKYEYLKLYDGNSEILGELIWNEQNDVLAFDPFEILPGRRKLKLALKIFYEENAGGTWRKVYFGGKPVEEIREVFFTTGEAPNTIVPENVAFTYPLDRQVNFMKNEYGEGYVILKNGQAYLFEQGSEWKQVARFSPVSGGAAINVPVRYDLAKKTVNFSIPATLRNKKVYKFQIVNTPASTGFAVDQNVYASVDKIQYDDENVVEVETKQAEGSFLSLQENELFGLAFRTSQYSTITEKLKSSFSSNGWLWPLITSIQDIGVDFRGEQMDYFDLYGGVNFKPLVRMMAGTNNPWYLNEIEPLIYSEYPLLGRYVIERRKPIDSLGVIPLKAIRLSQSMEMLMLSEGEINHGELINRDPMGSVIYKLPWHFYWDYVELQGKAINAGIANDHTRRLAMTPFPPIKSGSYEVVIEYVIPGLNKVTSTNTITIRNP